LSYGCVCAAFSGIPAQKEHIGNMATKSQLFHTFTLFAT